MARGVTYPLALGIDVGSTTVKAVVINPETMEILWSDYPAPQHAPAGEGGRVPRGHRQGIPRLAAETWRMFMDRVPDAERALSHMVGRLMDQEGGLKTLPVWEQFLYEVTMGGDANDREQAIEWYRELAEESSDPSVDLHLAILEGESGHLADVQQKMARWVRQGEPYPAFARLLQAGYVDARVPPASGFELQAYLAEQPVSGWFYSRLATRIAERSGDRPLLVTIETSSLQRVETVLWRSRVFALLELTLMIVGLFVLVLWVRRGQGAAMFRVGSAEFRK